jgi:iron complex outermembrane recepter protein
MLRAKITLLATSALAFAASPANAEQTSSPDVSDPTSISNEEIIVTAQKREQALIEIPQSISVVSGDVLAKQKAFSLVDYAALVPGLSLQQFSPGNTRVVLRGVNTGGCQSYRCNLS